MFKPSFFKTPSVILLVATALRKILLPCQGFLKVTGGEVKTPAERWDSAVKHVEKKASNWCRGMYVFVLTLPPNVEMFGRWPTVTGMLESKLQT